MNIRNLCVVAAFVVIGLLIPSVKGDDSQTGIALNHDGSFNYQGYLEFEGVPANGVYFFEVHLLDNNGNEIDPRFDMPGPITVTNGLFDMDILMGGTPVDADFFWRHYGNIAKSMRISVGLVEGGPYETLSPDVELGSSPHALHSLFASAIQFPYSDSFGSDMGDESTMITLTHEFGGTLINLNASIANSNSFMTIHGANPSGEDYGSQNGALQIDALDKRAGLVSIASEFAIVGVIQTPNPLSTASIFGQVSPGVEALGIWAINVNSNTSAALAGPNYAGDFEGDILARNDLRVQGEPTRDFATDNPSPIGPLAYGSISASGLITSGTANMSCFWDDASSLYVISVDGESMNFSTHIVSISVVDTAEPRLATFNNTSGNIVVKIWDINSGNIAVQDNFSIVIYDPAATTLNRLPAPNGTDEDKYTEQTGAQLIQTQPRNEPVEPFENYGSGINTEN